MRGKKMTTIATKTIENRFGKISIPCLRDVLTVDHNVAVKSDIEIITDKDGIASELEHAFKVHMMQEAIKWLVGKEIAGSVSLTAINGALCDGASDAFHDMARSERQGK
jgi:hypothetical protein